MSLTAMSAHPASLRLASTFDPMKPAPPVTNNIDAVTPLKRLAWEVAADPFSLSIARGAILDSIVATG
jgi:hypothetical protein